MSPLLRLSVLLVAVQPACMAAPEYFWQWDHGQFPDFSYNLPAPRLGSWLRLEPIIGADPAALPMEMATRREDAVRAGTPTTSHWQDPVPGHVPPVEAGSRVTFGLRPEAPNSPTPAAYAYQGMGMTDRASGDVVGAASFASGGNLIWQFVVPWYGYLLISPGFPESGWQEPLYGIPRPFPPVVPLTPSQPGYETGEGISFPVLHSPGFVIWLSAHQL